MHQHNKVRCVCCRNGPHGRAEPPTILSITRKHISISLVRHCHQTPFLPEEMQQVCLGSPQEKLWDQRRTDSLLLRIPSKRPQAESETKATSQEGQYVDLIDGLHALGLPVREEQVAAAVKQLFPRRHGRKGRAEVLREVFLFLKRQDSGDNVGR